MEMVGDRVTVRDIDRARDRYIWVRLGLGLGLGVRYIRIR
jgi:hypothetical protein